MAETRPARILDMSGDIQSSEQQYVEVGSNIYLGTKDGIKYTLIQASDKKFRLVEAPSDSSISLSDSTGSLETSQSPENSNVYKIDWKESQSDSKEIKIISLASGLSPCKGQGDEIGNTVISPRNFIKSFKTPDCAIVEKFKKEPTLENLSGSPVLAYTTLFPKQENEKLVSYYANPHGTCNTYSPVFPSPVSIRPTRYGRKPRMPFMPPASPYTPIPRARREAPRMRRPRQPLYKYTPQFLHSTPTNASYSNESSLSLSGGSSGGLSVSSFSKSDSSIEYPRVPNNTPTSSDAVSSGNQKIFSLEWMPYVENYISLTPKEAHNEKERHRRLRIKNACQSMRGYMPWLNEKTDNATIFEEVVSYITYIKGMIGCEYDVEFMEKSYTY